VTGCQDRASWLNFAPVFYLVYSHKTLWRGMYLIKYRGKFTSAFHCR